MARVGEANTFLQLSRPSAPAYSGPSQAQRGGETGYIIIVGGMHYAQVESWRASVMTNHVSSFLKAATGEMKERNVSEREK